MAPANFIVGSFKDINCSKCGKKTEHIAITYTKSFGGTAYVWRCTHCKNEIVVQ